MIPIRLYHDKIGELQHVLAEMGKEPHELAAWLFNDRNLSEVKLAKLRSGGEQSSSLIRSMPKFSGASVLGLRLTEPKRARLAAQILERNQNELFEEINEIENIERMLRTTYANVVTRTQAVMRFHGYLNNRSRFGDEAAGEAREQATHVAKVVLPVLNRLKSEIEGAIKFCGREIKDRTRQIDRINRKQLSAPKYNKRARRKRKMRAAAKAAAAEAESKADKGLGDDGGD